ncbi:spore germination protein, partial [Faecalibacterium duncaniae]|uniref:spore germination protein n=1 Tax=Faecalibacterium duncaniae (strain DSM 17677 / JCM 31915 / A2-165) TaxID=411483 RepID=UPI002941928D
LGHSVSLIAALIIGDAAIAAGLMSTPVILTAAAASIAVFVTPQLLLDSSYFVPWLFPCKIRTFAPVRYTERPIVAAAKLREGK